MAWLLPSPRLIALILGAFLALAGPTLADDAPPPPAPQQAVAPEAEDADSRFLPVQDKEHDDNHDNNHDDERNDTIDADEWAATIIIGVLGLALLTFSLVQIGIRARRLHEKPVDCVKGYCWDCLRSRGFIWWIPAILVAFSFYSLAIEAIYEREFHGMVFAFLPGTTVLLARYIGALLTRQEQERRDAEKQE